MVRQKRFQFFTKEGKQWSSWFNYDGPEEAIQQLQEMTVEKDNDEFLVQVVHQEVKEDYGRAKAILRINHKGWGGDYFRSIIVEPAYYHG